MGLACLLLSLGLGGCDPSAEVPVPESSSSASSIPALAARPTPPPPAPLPAALRSAYRDLSAGQFERGRSAAQAYLALHPGDAQANLMIGLSFFKADNHGAARPYFEAALEADPEYYITYDYLAEACFLLGELEAARAHYHSFRSFVPGEPRTYVRLGVIELEQSRPELAAAYFREALSLFDALQHSDPRSYGRQQPELASAHARMGELHFAAGEYELARTELEQATGIWPGNISAFYTLSQVYRRLGEDELADGAARHYESERQQRIDGGTPK